MNEAKSQIWSCSERASQHKSKFKTVIDAIVTLIDSQFVFGRHPSLDFKEDEEECLWSLVSSKETAYLSYVNKAFTHFQRKTACVNPE